MKIGDIVLCKGEFNLPLDERWGVGLIIQTGSMFASVWFHRRHQYRWMPLDDLVMYDPQTAKDSIIKSHPAM